jgi:tRNA-intron endonuclease, archaea type
MIEGILIDHKVFLENSDLARDFYSKSRYGDVVDSGIIKLSLHEALFLFDNGKIIIKSQNKRVITKEQFIKKAKKIENNFWTRYCVFRDLRKKGYIVKTALKFGAEFRVYDKGIKPGEDHAKWIVYPVYESEVLTWYEFSAKNRVAHSTKKRLLIGIVDDESEVTYYEIAWKRP